MKKILIISDSHGHGGRIDYVLEKESAVDTIIHCGDLCENPSYYPNMHIVSGNNDYYDLPQHLFLKIGKHKVMVTHSHQYSYIRRDEQMWEVAKENHCDMICYGHSHLPHIEEQNGILFINPGSLQYNRDGSGQSYVRLYIDEDRLNPQLVYIKSNN